MALNIDIDEVDKRFELRDLNPAQYAKAVELRRQTLILARLMARALPEGRNKSLAVTHLEDALMRATRSIAEDE